MNNCDKCKQTLPTRCFGFKYGEWVGSRVEGGTSGIYTVTRTITSYKVLDTPTFHFCNQCIRRHKLKLLGRVFFIFVPTPLTLISLFVVHLYIYPNSSPGQLGRIDGILVGLLAFFFIAGFAAFMRYDTATVGDFVLNFSDEKVGGHLAWINWRRDHLTWMNRLRHRSSAEIKRLE